jgi:hypothetical protein
MDGAERTAAGAKAGTATAPGIIETAVAERDAADRTLAGADGTTPNDGADRRPGKPGAAAPSPAAGTTVAGNEGTAERSTGATTRL